MNFKEQYKKANDEIAGDSALLEKILSTPQKEKTKIIPIVYKAASLAAAFILIATVALMPVIKDKFIADETPATETVTTGETAETEEAAFSDVATVNAEYGAEEFSMPEVKTAKRINNDNVKSYGFSEAIAFLGIDAESLSVENMELVYDEVYYITHFEDGQVGYEISYRLEDGDRNMMVILTGSIDAFDLSVEEVNGEITASKTIGNTDVFIRASGVAKEEVEKYINDICLKEEL